MIWKFEPSELVNFKHFNEWINEKGGKNVRQKLTKKSESHNEISYWMD